MASLSTRALVAEAEKSGVKVFICAAGMAAHLAGVVAAETVRPVIGVPVGGTDQRAKAFVVLRQGETATEEEILAFCRERLAKYKVPKSVEFRDDLPKTMVGKYLRRVLVEEERARHARGADA